MNMDTVSGRIVLSMPLETLDDVGDYLSGM
jgi:hypothetical protein